MLSRIGPPIGVLLLPLMITVPPTQAKGRKKGVVVFVPAGSGKLVRTTMPASAVRVVRAPKPAWPFPGANLPKSLPHGIGEVGDLPVWVRSGRSKAGANRQRNQINKPKPVLPFEGADRPLSLPHGIGEAGDLPKWVSGIPVVKVIKADKRKPAPRPVLPFEGADRPLSLPHGIGEAGNLPKWVGRPSTIATVPASTR